jgi:hypothetical protein
VGQGIRCQRREPQDKQKRVVQRPLERASPILLRRALPRGRTVASASTL